MTILYGDNPCKECKPPKRHPGCHGTCEERRIWKEELDSKKAQIFADKHRESQLDSFEQKRMKRNKRR